MSELDLTEAIEAAAQGLTDYRQGKGCSPDIQSKTYAEAAVRAAAPIIERAVRDEVERLRAEVAAAVLDRDEERVDADAARRRANEAARLSAEARDHADDLRTTIANLKEHIEIVESDRTDFDEWTLRVATKHGLPDDDPEPELRDRIARYLDEVLAERDRLGNEANRIAQVAKRFRAECDAYRAVVDAARAYSACLDKSALCTEALRALLATVDALDSGSGTEPA